MDRPVIQISGDCPETLASISYDLADELGVMTGRRSNQQTLHHWSFRFEKIDPIRPMRGASRLLHHRINLRIYETHAIINNVRACGRACLCLQCPGARPRRPNAHGDCRDLHISQCRQGAPPGVPRGVDTNGDVVTIPTEFTTRLYRDAALDLVLQEANQVARELQLPEELPITRSNIVTGYIDPFGASYIERFIGNVTTKNYAYYVSVDDKFSYLEGTHRDEDGWKYSAEYSWPVSQIDTNLAYQQATQWLCQARMDVAGLNRDCEMVSQPDRDYCHSPPGKFAPLYDVFWKQKTGRKDNVAEVTLFTPTKALMEMRVEDTKYILRAPLVFSNLAALFPGVAPIVTNHLMPRAVYSIKSVGPTNDK